MCNVTTHLIKTAFNRVQFGCQNEILLPVVDADGDDVKCRWSNGSECGSICNALPGAGIDSV